MARFDDPFWREVARDKAESDAKRIEAIRPVGGVALINATDLRLLQRAARERAEAAQRVVDEEDAQTAKLLADAKARVDARGLG